MIDHLSYSGFSTWKECGEKFRLTRIIKVPEVPGYALVGGSAVHAATEAIDKASYGIGEPMTFMEAFEIEASETVRRSGITEDGWRVSGKPTKDFPDKEDRKWWEWNGPVFVQNYIDWKNRYPGNIWITPDDVPAIELPIKTRFGGADVIGYIDRIFEHDGVLTVVDIKAGRTTPPDGMQLAVYGAGLPAAWPMPQRGSYMMARDSRLIGDYWLPALYPRVNYEFDQAWTDINSGSFLPKETYMCKFCSVREYCWAKNGDMSEGLRPF